MRLPLSKVNPTVLGLSIISILLFSLLLHEYLIDRLTVIFEPGSSRHDDFRIAIIHCFLAGYVPAAYFHLMHRTKNNIDELENIMEPVNGDSAVHLGKKSLILGAFMGVMLAVFTTFLTAQSYWVPSTWNPEVWWHRGLGLFVGIWGGWFIFAIWHTSTLISRLAARIKKVDLLDLGPLSPFVNQGLLTTLLLIGLASIFSLFLLEPGQWPAVVILFGLTIPMALLGLLLPVRGLHRIIRDAKQAEINWSRNKIRQSRNLLHSVPPDVSSGQMADMEAYLRLIEDVPEWPFQTSTIVRLVFYLMIPIASWFGGLLIESVLELIWNIG